MTKKTHSEKETFNFAKDYAKKLQGGEVLCLVGDLGAGKTAFTKGLAAGLGVGKIVTSPTFVLMKVYQILKSKNQKTNVHEIAHIDAYRLKGGQELINIGADEYFHDMQCVTVIEWADRVKDIWPKGYIKICFKILKGDERVIEIKK